MKAIQRWAQYLSALLLTLMLGTTYADNTLVVGQWQTRDDHTNKPNSVITIWQDKGKFYGRISKIYRTKDSNPNDICSKCKGAKHNKPILGLVIIDNMVLKGNKYVGGTILDPRDGKTYRCTLQLGPDGKTLKVRGYIGLPILGKSTIWYRM